MRVVVLTLLLANLLFFGWQYLLPENQPDTLQDAYKGVPSLELAPREEPEAAIADPEPQLEDALEIDGEMMAENEASAAETSAPQPQAASPEMPAPAVCANLGPFADQDAARAAIQSFSLSRFNPVVNQRQVSRLDYWVYIPPFRDRASANLALNMLASRGIKDAYIVGSGEDRNAIALGLFSEEARAKRRQEQLENIGMAARIGVVDRSESVFFVNMELPSLDDFDAALLGASENSSLSFAAADCEAKVQGEEADVN